MASRRRLACLGGVLGPRLAGAGALFGGEGTGMEERSRPALMGPVGLTLGRNFSKLFVKSFRMQSFDIQICFGSKTNTAMQR
jgi:hypothetical protein